MRKLSICLLYLYAFLIPQEYLWVYLFDSYTVLKPYRIVGMAFLVVSLAMNAKNRQFHLEKEDKYWLLILINGFVITVLWKIYGQCDLYYALRVLTLIGFPFLIALMVHNLSLSEAEIHRVFTWFVISVGLNVGSVIYKSFSQALVYRPSGMYSNSIFLGSAIAISLIYFVYLLFSDYISKLTRKVVYITFPCYVLALLLTGARSSTFGFFTGILIFLSCIQSIRRNRLLIGFIIIIVFAGIVSYGYESMTLSTSLDRFDVENMLGRESRFDIWRSALSVAVDHCLLGIGIGQYKEYHLSYAGKLSSFSDPRTMDLAYVTHSDVISLVTEYGIVSLILYCLIVFSIAKGLKRLTKMHNKHKLLGALLLAVFLSNVFFGLFREDFTSPDIWLFYAISLTFIRSYRMKNSRDHSKSFQLRANGSKMPMHVPIPYGLPLRTGK